MKIFDAHQDIGANVLLVTGKNFFEHNALYEGHIRTKYRCVNQVDLPRLRKGNVKLVFAAIFARTKKQAVEQFHLYTEIIKNSKGAILPVLSRRDLQKIKGEKIGFLFHMEGADPIEKPADLDFFHALGLRSIGICWRTKNQYVGESALTKKGMELIKCIESKRMILDLAHAHEKLFWNILRHFHKRFIVSHTACKSLCPNRRNLSGDQIMEIITRRGLIGICGVNLMLGGSSITNITDHMKYIAKKGGIHTLCFGSDFDGMVHPKIILVKGFEDVSCYPNVIRKLLQSFGNKEVCRKIAYGNLKEFIEYAL